MSIKSSLYHWFYIFVESVLSTVQLVTWRYYGIIEQLKCSSYEKSAHVCKILLRNKTGNLDLSSKRDFLYVHKEFVNPCIVLNDNVSLYSLNEKEAIFVDCGNINIFSSKHDSFLYNTQYMFAKNLVIMPISSLKEISKELLLPKIPMMHALNHSRCGSTLLFKLFEAIPNSLAISEPNSFTDLSEISRKGRLSRNELKELCYCALVMLVKHAQSRNSELIFLKCQSLAIYISDVMFDAMPSVKQIYMYRQPVPFVRSYEKLYLVNNWKQLSVKQLKFWAGIGHHDILEDYHVYPFHMLYKFSNFAKLSLIWITATAVYQELVKKSYPIKTIVYEELISDPKHVMELLLKFMEASVPNLPDIDAVMKVDSQVGTTYTSRNADVKKLEMSFTKINKELKEEINEISSDFNVPLFWEPIRLSNKLD